MEYNTKFKAQRNSKFGWATKNKVVFFIEFNQPNNPICSFNNEEGKLSIPEGDRVEDNLIFNIGNLEKAETLLFMYLKANNKRVKIEYVL